MSVMLKNYLQFGMFANYSQRAMFLFYHYTFFNFKHFLHLKLKEVQELFGTLNIIGTR